MFRKILESLRILNPTLTNVWEYGTLNGLEARRHKKYKNVQFILWEAGEQGHKKDFWHDSDKSWWREFIPTN